MPRISIWMRLTLLWVSDRLESVLAQVSRDVHELNRAAEEIRGNARWLVEHASTQSSVASEIAATLREMSSAGARTREATRDLRRILASGAAPVRHDDGRAKADHALLTLAPGGATQRSPHALLDCSEESLDALRSGVAQVNQFVLGVESMARDNSMKAQRLWCTAEALSRRAAALEEVVEYFRVRELRPAEPLAASDEDARRTL
jgi:hypothetical protein